MTKSPVILSVVFEAAAGREDELSAALGALVEPTRAEEGCLAYELSTSTETFGHFFFYEKFVDQAALDAHIASPYFQNFATQRETNDPVANVTVMRWTSLK